MADFGYRFAHTSLVFDDKMWVIAGENLFGVINDVWYSTDGVFWLPSTHSAQFGARRSHASTVHNSEMYVIGGTGDNMTNTKMNDVWSSADGKTWTKLNDDLTGNVGMQDRFHHTVVSFNGNLVVLAGFRIWMRNDMWISTDNGANWIQTTGDATFMPRIEHSTILYDNQIVTIGGWGAYGVLNDVWKSVDGLTLQQVRGWAD